MHLSYWLPSVTWQLCARVSSYHSFRNCQCFGLAGKSIYPVCTCLQLSQSSVGRAQKHHVTYDTNVHHTNTVVWEAFVFTEVFSHVHVLIVSYVTSLSSFAVVTLNMNSTDLHNYWRDVSNQYISLYTCKPKPSPKWCTARGQVHERTINV